MKPSQNCSGLFEINQWLGDSKDKKTAGITIPKFHRTLHYGRSYQNMMMHALKSTLIADFYITNTIS